MPPKVPPLRMVASATPVTNATSRTITKVDRPCSSLRNNRTTRLAVEGRSQAQMTVCISEVLTQTRNGAVCRIARARYSSRAASHAVQYKSAYHRGQGQAFHPVLLLLATAQVGLGQKC